MEKNENLEENKEGRKEGRKEGNKSEDIKNNLNRKPSYKIQWRRDGHKDWMNAAWDLYLEWKISIEEYRKIEKITKTY